MTLHVQTPHGAQCECHTCLGDLFAEHYPRLVRQLDWMRKSYGCDVEEGCAFAFEQLLAGKLQDRSNVGGWLRTVAWHECLRQVHKTAPDVELHENGHAGAAASAEDEALRRIEAQSALRRVAALRPHQRTAVALQVGGHTYREIMALTGSTYTWTNRHVHEGRSALRKGRDA